MKDEYCKAGKYRGYRYCVRRTDAGTVCCYVNVQQNAYMREAYAAGLGFDSADSVFALHGGVTYFQRGVPPAHGQLWDEWHDDLVVGCDYGHFGDTEFSFSPRRGYMSNPSNMMRSVISEADAEAELKAAIDAALSRFDL